MRLWPGKMSTRLTLASPSFWTKVCASWLVSPPGAKDPASYIAKAIEPVLHWANLSRRPGDPWLSRWRARCQCRQSTSLAILAQASVNPSARLSTALTSFLGSHMEVSQEQLHSVMPCAPSVTPHGGIDHVVPPFADLHSALYCLANVRCTARRREAEHGCRRCGKGLSIVLTALCRSEKTA